MHSVPTKIHIQYIVCPRRYNIQCILCPQRYNIQCIVCTRRYTIQWLPAKKATEKKATFLLGKKSHGKKSHQIGEKSQIMLSNYFAHYQFLLYHIVPRVRVWVRVTVSNNVLIGEKQTVYGLG